MKQTLLPGAIIVAFAGFFGYHMVYRPQQVKLAEYPRQLAREQADYQAQADVAALAERVESYRRRLPREGDTSWLVNEVVSVANDVGVQVTRIVPEPPRDFQGVTRLGVSLQVTASYHQVGAFLDRIERGALFIRVDRADLSGASDIHPSSERTIQLVLSTLYVPPLTLADTRPTAAPVAR
ncbi:MAG: type 4a pilus biogenesis protein PilO [Candidatus Omnitrophica bacterium]|nr:type 4a pilus biogenesis protein PilO [Candidatus Omnitrophota bacterium]